MKITFKRLEDRRHNYIERARHEVWCDEKLMFSGNEGIEPEDVMFYRDLPDPFDCQTLLEKVVEHVKNGGEVEFDHITEEWK